MFCVEKKHRRSLEDALCSRTRWKILKLLAKYGQLHTSAIAKKLRSNYTSTDTHLKLLTDEGILQQRNLGKTRLYRIDMQSKTALTILAVLKEFEQAGSH